MRFGLSDLEELPSLKEFEALAREALGGDEGIAPPKEEVGSGEWRVASENQDAGAVEANHGTPASEEQSAVAEEQKELVAEEVAATNEGMPAGETDEEAKAAKAGE